MVEIEACNAMFLMSYFWMFLSLLIEHYKKIYADDLVSLFDLTKNYFYFVSSIDLHINWSMFHALWFQYTP